MRGRGKMHVVLWQLLRLILLPLPDSRAAGPANPGLASGVSYLDTESPRKAEAAKSLGSPPLLSPQELVFSVLVSVPDAYDQITIQTYSTPLFTKVSEIAIATAASFNSSEIAKELKLVVRFEIINDTTSNTVKVIQNQDCSDALKEVITTEYMEATDGEAEKENSHRLAFINCPYESLTGVMDDMDMPIPVFNMSLNSSCKKYLVIPFMISPLDLNLAIFNSLVWVLGGDPHTFASMVQREKQDSAELETIPKLNVDIIKHIIGEKCFRKAANAA